ncbi:M23 family metallopeptidase [Burkholderia glumae]|uniref:M23 family metallopeptidase n=1 Tax=Burkholderia glumae TaxID=337 RepID=UPI002036DF89|nr:M23 family metallopeptidase [Burkholderia glumae]MCM2493369.1 M23 family metallopeptidase [Burkholderia glumae]MCM2544045.1 M23 family metallopeptidase [Burkholderia glumae]
MYSPLIPRIDLPVRAGGRHARRPAPHPLARLVPATGVIGALAALAALALTAAPPAASTPATPTLSGAAKTPLRVFAATPFPSAQRFVTEQLEAELGPYEAAPGRLATRPLMRPLVRPFPRPGLLGDASDLFSLAAPPPHADAPLQAGGVRAGTIERSFADTLQRLDVPPEVRIQLGDLVATHTHPHAAAQPGDRYRLAYAITPDGPRLTALDLRSAGRHFGALWFRPPGATHGAFYRYDGTPLEAAALIMPVAATRISSPFGERLHPISHLRLMHTGTDFAAPRGTRVNAAADGVVSFVGIDPHGYGRYVVVEHPGGVSTLYAHLSAFAPGLEEGMRVAQGQRLGAVGMTGAATGPHLHFEVRRADTPVDPVVALADASNTLAPMQLDAFRREATAMRTQLAAAAAPATGIAMLDTAPADAGLSTLDPTLRALLPAPGQAAASARAAAS